MILFRIYVVIFITALVEALFSFRVFYVHPELTLLVLVFFSLKVNSRNALFLGCFSGFLKDVISVSTFGKHLIIFAVLAVILNQVKRLLYEIPDYIPILAVGIVLLIYSIVSLFLDDLRLGYGLNFRVILYVFLVIFVNTIISPLVFKITKNALKYN